MASISISIDDGATVRAHMTIGNPCMSIYVSCDIPPSYAGGNPIPYGRDDLMIHGSPAEVAAFAHAILAAIPPQEPDTPIADTATEYCGKCDRVLENCYCAAVEVKS